MKKILILTTSIMLLGCAELTSMFSSSSSDTTSSSARARMQSCMLAEAQSKLQAGTLFTSSITETAQNLVSTCTKKLALESMGISQQSQSDATDIINSLRNLGSD